MSDSPPQPGHLMARGVDAPECPTTSAPALITTGPSTALDSPGDEGKEDILERLRAYGEMKGSRDDLIREADARDVEETRIARLMRHSRTTVRSVLGRR